MAARNSAPSACARSSEMPETASLIMDAAACTMVVVLGLHQAFMPSRDAQGLEKAVALLGSIPAPLLFFLLAILPPFCEELLCRGFFLSAFRSRHGARTAVVLVAVLFGALHLDLYRFPATFAAGLMLGYVCVRTGSLFASILFHAVYNGILATSMFTPYVARMLEGVGLKEAGLAALGLSACIALIHRWARLTGADPSVDSEITARP